MSDLLFVMAAFLQQAAVPTSQDIDYPTCMVRLRLFDEEPSSQPPGCVAVEKTVVRSAEDDASKTLNERLRGIENKSWPEYYMVAAELIKAGRPAEAGMWFYVGQLRGRINVRCVKQDPTGGPAALSSLNSILGVPINEYLGASPDKWAATIQHALNWDEAHDDPENAGKSCADIRKVQRAGLADLKADILSRKDEIRAERKKNGLPND